MAVDVQDDSQPSPTQFYPSPDSKPDIDPYAALRYRNFQLLVIGFALGVLGMQIQATAIGWEMYEWTGSKMVLGNLGLAMGLPTLLFSLYAGHLADKINRRILIVASLSVVVVCSLALSAVSYSHAHSLLSTGTAKWTTYALLFLSGTAGTFGRPARAALMPQVVPPEHFSNAVTWNTTVFETCTVLGPAVAGFVLLLDKPIAYLLCAVFVMSYMAMTAAITAPNPPKSDKKFSLEVLFAGVKFVTRNRLLLGAMTLDLFAVLFGGATYLLPVFAKDILHVNELHFGLLRAAPSIGAIAMAITIAHRKPIEKAGRTLLLAIIGFGLATIVFGLSKNFYLSFAMLLLTGVFDNLNVVIRHTLVQVMTPDHMRGRVAAVNQVFIGSSNEIGGFESGLTAQLFGPIASVVGGGIATLLVVATCAFTWPELGKLARVQDVKPVEEDK